jgi:hypothetical protein
MCCLLAGVQLDHQAVWCVAKYCSKHASDGIQVTNVPILCFILYRCQHKQHQERQVSVATLCRDKAWSVNRLGRIARLHHQPEACVQIINTLYGFNAMEVQEAFVKVSACTCFARL